MLIYSTKLYLLLLTAFVLQASCSAASEPVTLKPIIAWAGTVSQQQQPLVLRCSSQDAWDKMWHTIRGPSKPRAGEPYAVIDFSSYMVVAIFSGTLPHNRGLRIETILNERQVVRIRYRILWYQTGFAEKLPKKPDPIQTTRSYCLLLLPTCGKTLIIEEDVGNIIGGKPVWKERAALAPNQSSASY